MKLYHLYIVFILFILAGCTPEGGVSEIKLATTTSTQASGLLDYLLPHFEAKTGIKVQVIAQGTGKALKSGELGNVDVVFVHARTLEDKFVADGFGVYRRDVMHNDFIIVGPPEDPAGIKGLDADTALKKIFESQANFCSRGDESGTHFKEKQLWKDSGLDPFSHSGKWYLELGKGMDGTLVTANEKKAYTLADRGTYIAFRKRIKLEILVQGDKRLFNPYGVIAVNPEKHPHVSFDSAKKFIDWIVSEEGQGLISKFEKDGEKLFFLDAIK